MRSRYRFIQNDRVYFITATVVEWLPVFTNEKYCQIIIESLKYCKTNKGLKIIAYVILDNHVHMVIEAPNISQTIADFKKFTAREIFKMLASERKKWLLNQFAYCKKAYKNKSNYQLWQEGVHPQMILSEDMLIQKIHYIHNNPVKRGIVERPEHWRFSSARNYCNNDDSILEIDRFL